MVRVTSVRNWRRIDQRWYSISYKSVGVAHLVRLGMRASRSYRLAAITIAAAIAVSACGGPPATEADRLALIGGWAPTGKYSIGVTLLDTGFVVVHANGDFDFYEKPGYIARRSWELRSQTTLVLTSGNQISTTCTIELSASALKNPRWQRPALRQQRARSSVEDADGFLQGNRRNTTRLTAHRTISGLILRYQATASASSRRSSFPRYG
jgi:hypothetical protein